MDLRISKCKTLTKKYRPYSETEDILISTLKLKDGTLGNIEVNVYSKFKNVESSIFIIGTKGSVKIGGNSINKLVHLNTLDKVNLPKMKDEPLSPYTLHARLIATLSRFLLRGENCGLNLLTRPEDMKKLIVFIEKIYNNTY